MLICPGVALAAMQQFFINKGLVGIGLIDKFRAIYWLLTHSCPVSIPTINHGI